MLEVVFTGCPRSGTKYIHKLMCFNNVMIGHEVFFGMPGVGTIVDNMTGDSSWLAVPYLKELKKNNTKIIHIVRNPIKVVNSLMVNNIFVKKDLSNIFLEYAFPRIKNYQGIDKYIYFYIKWNEEIGKYADKRFRIEDVTKNPVPLFEYIGEEYFRKYKDVKCNSRVNKIIFTKKDINKSQFKKEFKAMMKKYGY